MKESPGTKGSAENKITALSAVPSCRRRKPEARIQKKQAWP